MSTLEQLAESARLSAIEVVRLREQVAANPERKAARGWDLKMLHSHQKKVRLYADHIIRRLTEAEQAQQRG